MVASALSQGILPGLQTAEKLRMGRAARESQAQADMIALSQFNKDMEQERLEAQAAKRLLETMRGDRSTEIGAPNVSDFGEYFQNLGTELINAGVPRRGQELLIESVDYRKKQADINNTEETIQKTRLENIIKAGNYMYNALGVAGNESEYRHIWDSLPDDIVQILGPENVEALKNTPWSPEFQGYLRDRSMSIKDQASLVLNERRTVATERRTEDARAYHKVMEELGRGRLEEQRRANDRLEKAGGPNITSAATNAELSAARDILNNSIEGLADIDDGATKDAVNHALQEMVGRAKVLLRENRGIETMDQALGQAFMEMDAAGDFEILTSRGFFGIGRERTKGVKYSRRGRSQANPAPMPEGSRDEVASKLVRDRYYDTPMGILKWNGEEFEQ